MIQNIDSKKSELAVVENKITDIKNQINNNNVEEYNKKLQCCKNELNNYVINI